MDDCWTNPFIKLFSETKIPKRLPNLPAILMIGTMCFSESGLIHPFNFHATYPTKSHGEHEANPTIHWARNRGHPESGGFWINAFQTFYCLPSKVFITTPCQINFLCESMCRLMNFLSSWVLHYTGKIGKGPNQSTLSREGIGTHP